jgi:hypothetical protein
MMDHRKRYAARFAAALALTALGFYGMIGSGHAQEMSKAKVVIQRIKGDTVFASGRQFILTEDTRFWNQAGEKISIGEVSFPAKGLILYQTVRVSEDAVRLLATKIVLWIKEKPPTPE